MPAISGQAFPPLPRVTPQAIETPPAVEPASEPDSQEIPAPTEASDVEMVEPPRPASPPPPARYNVLPLLAKQGKKKKNKSKPKTSQPATAAPNKAAAPKTPKAKQTAPKVVQNPPPASKELSTKKQTAKPSTAASARKPSSGTPSTMDEIRSFLEEFDLVQVAATFRMIRDKLSSANATEKFLLLAEAAAAIGLL